MNLSYHYMLMVNHVILQKKLFLSLKDTGLTLGQPKVLDFLRGKEMAAATEKRFEELEAQAFAGISGEERRSFLKTFEKIYQNMETLEGNTHDRKN